jgi:hypothetical protein
MRYHVGLRDSETLCPALTQRQMRGNRHQDASGRMPVRQASPRCPDPRGEHPFKNSSGPLEVTALNAAPVPTGFAILNRGFSSKRRMREKRRNEKGVNPLKTNNPAKSLIQRS